jgi:hypothetical protein
VKQVSTLLTVGLPRRDCRKRSITFQKQTVWKDKMKYEKSEDPAKAQVVNENGVVLATSEV